MLEVSEREEGVVARSGLEPVRDANPVPTSPLADEITGSAFSLHFHFCLIFSAFA